MSQRVHGLDARLRYVLQNISLDSKVLRLIDSLYILSQPSCELESYNYQRIKNQTYTTCNIRPR